MVLVVALLLTVPAVHVTAASAPIAARLIVTLHEVPRSLAVGSSYDGARVVMVEPALSFAVVTTDDRASFEAQAAKDANVLRTANDTFGNWLQWIPQDTYSTEYGPQLTRAAEAWDTSFGTTAKRVCIVDTGVRYTHEDLAGPRWLGGTNVAYGTTDPWDDHGHGTHVTGIAAATINNQKGIAGMSQAGILAAKVLNSNGQGYDSWVASGIRWCADNGGDVISMSLGGGGSQVLADAVDYAWGHGSLVVAAAGNSGPCSNCISYPAGYAHAMAVTCVDWNSQLCSFSSTGPQASVAAPGLYIRSLWNSGNSAVATLSGTSMSTPHVSGIAALIWSYAPDLSNDQIRQLLESTSHDLGPSGRDTSFGFGLIDAKSALDKAGPPAAETPIFTENFDGASAPAFTLNGLWHTDDRCFVAPSTPRYLGYHRTGACDYNTLASANSGQATFSIDLTAQLRATLHIKHRFEVEASSSGVHDLMDIDARADNGAWVTLRRWSSMDAPLSAWTPVDVSLGNFVGHKTEIRFAFDTTDAFDNAHPGWYIDDVNVTGLDNYPPFVLAGQNMTLADPDGDGQAVARLSGIASDRDDAITSTQWTEGATTLATTLAANVTLAVGAHALTLTATDAAGKSSSSSVTITVVPNVAPIARAGSDITARDADGTGAEAVPLDGSSSTDADGSLVNFTWLESGAAVAFGSKPTLTLGVGTHTLTLRVTDNGGATSTDDVVVRVLPNAAPTAQAGPDVTTTDADSNGRETIGLSGLGSVDSDGTLTTYEWRENGTLLATGARASVDLTVGTHEIVLTVTDNGGATATDSLIASVLPDRAPIARAGADVTRSDWDGDGRETFAVDGSTSTDPDGAITTYRWSEGSTTLASTARATLNLTVGRHTLILTVTDNGGVSGADDIILELTPDLPPIARAGADRTAADADGTGAETLTLDGSASSDPDGHVLTYSWVEGGRLLSSVAQPTLDFAVGSHVITLTVTDDAAVGGSDDININVSANMAPIARAGADIAATDADGTGAESIRLADGGSSDADGRIISYAWTEGTTLLATQAAANVTFAVGVHNVTLEVTDNGGARARDDLVVRVAPNTPPLARALVTCVELTCAFNASQSSDAEGPIARFAWEFGDGASSSAASVQHTYALEGTLAWNLSVTDGGNAVATKSGTVNVAFLTPRAAPTRAPPSPHARDTVSDPGDQSRVPWLDVESSWFEADGRHLYVGMKVHQGAPAGLPIEYDVSFVNGWTPPDPRWGGAVPAGEIPEGLRVSATPTSDATTSFMLEVLSRTTTGIHHSTSLARVNGSLDPVNGIVWWSVDRSQLQSPPDGVLLRSPTGSLRAWTSSMTAIDTTGPGSTFVLGFVGRASSSLTRYDFNGSDEGFAVTGDSPLSYAGWDPADGTIMLSGGEQSTVDEAFSHALDSTLTPNSGSFSISAHMRPLENGVSALLVPLFVGGSPSDFQADRGQASFLFVSAGTIRCSMQYRDLAGVQRLNIAISGCDVGEQVLSVDYDGPIHTLTLRVTKLGGASVASASYVVGTRAGDGFSFTRFGVGNHGLGLAWAAPATILVDDIVVTQPQPS